MTAAQEESEGDARAPAVTVRAARTDELERCFAIRMEVFVDEQKVELALELDGLDEAARHFLAFDGERAVGTARLRMVDGYAKAERVAVLADARGLGVGAALMEAIHEAARSDGAREVRLNAQIQALPFYERLGYQAEGAEFIEAQIPHLHMRRAL